MEGQTRTDGRRDRWTDVQTQFYRILPARPGIQQELLNKHIHSAGLRLLNNFFPWTTECNGI